MSDLTLLIECLQHRDGGTRIPMPSGETYYFKPDGQTPARHVALVSNEDDISRFLAVPEGFRAIGRIAKSEASATALGVAANPAPTTAPVTSADTPVTLANDLRSEMTAEEADAQETVAQNITEALSGGPTTATEAPANGESQSETNPGAAPGTPNAATGLDELEDEKLRELFLLEIGRKPNPQAKRTTMIAQIVANREERAGH